MFLMCYCFGFNVGDLNYEESTKQVRTAFSPFMAVSLFPPFRLFRYAWEEDDEEEEDDEAGEAPETKSWR